MFLWLIITGLGGALTISHIVGSGTFAEAAKRVVASEHLYRVALSSELIETLSAALLAFALYVTLKPVDKLLAQMAMYSRLGESFIGGVGMIIGFVKLRLYTSPESIGTSGADQSHALMGLARTESSAVGEIRDIRYVAAVFFAEKNVDVVVFHSSPPMQGYINRQGKQTPGIQRWPRELLGRRLADVRRDRECSSV